MIYKCQHPAKLSYILRINMCVCGHILHCPIVQVLFQHYLSSNRWKWVKNGIDHLCCFTPILNNIYNFMSTSRWNSAACGKDVHDWYVPCQVQSSEWEWGPPTHILIFLSNSHPHPLLIETCTLHGWHAIFYSWGGEKVIQSNIMYV